MLSDDIAKVFRICGYILLYFSAAIIAGIIGRLAHRITEKFVLEKLFQPHIKHYRDWIEVSQPICVLTCVTGFLIVAVGLLFLHLIGLLPQEYDEVAVQIVIAFFGLAVFVCMGLVVFCIGCVLLWGVLWCRGRRSKGSDVDFEDEETGLLKHARRRYDDLRAEDYIPEMTPAIEQERRASPVRRLYAASTGQVQKPKQSWIKMISLSSVRNLDFSRMRERLGDIAGRDSFAVH